MSTGCGGANCGGGGGTLRPPARHGTCGGGGGGGGGGGCGGGDCQQGQQQQQQQGSFGSWVRRAQPSEAAAADAGAQEGERPAAACLKCKQARAVVLIRQQEPYCSECLEAGVQQKVRVATKTQGLIRAGDRAALALSGGPASLALLVCLAQMRGADGGRPERGKVAYDLLAVHVDSSAARGVPPAEAAATLGQLRGAAAAAGLAGPVLVLQLQDVFDGQEQLAARVEAQLAAAAAAQQQQQPQQQQQQPPDTVAALQAQMQAAHLAAPHQQSRLQCEEQQQQQQQLEEPHAAPPPAAGASPEAPAAAGAGGAAADAEGGGDARLRRLLDLAGSVADTTGREDLLAHLQDRLLLRAAAAAGCSRLLRGDTASRVAVRVIAEAAKGRGYSLPADIQALDAREVAGGGPAVLLPLREVTRREAEALCDARGVPWRDEPAGAPRLAGPLAGGGGGRAHRRAGVSVNALAERFVDEMQRGLPASVFTVLRTATQLQPFAFSHLSAVPEVARAQREQQQRRQQRQQGQQQQPQEQQRQREQQPQQQPLRLCALCRAPLPPAGGNGSAAAGPGRGGQGDAASAAALACQAAEHSRQLCFSCNRQVLHRLEEPGGGPGGGGGGGGGGVAARLERLRQLLPPDMRLGDEDEEDDEGW